MEGRTPPHSLDAEKSVLGAVMLSKEALYEVLETLRADDFYDANNKEIFKAITDLSRKNTPVDALTVSEELKKKNSLEMVGGRGYVASLPAGTPTVSNAEEYAKIIAEKAAIRRLIEVSDDVMTKGYDDSIDANQLIDYAEGGIFEIAQQKHKGKYAHIKDILLDNIERIDEASRMDGGLTGVTTGFHELDNLTAGLQKSNLIILGARPAMGKTSFALSLSLNAAVKGKASVMFFSMEMAKEEIGLRLLAMESKVDMQKLKTGTLDRNDWDDVNNALEILSETNINIDDTPGITLMEMKSKCRRLMSEKGLDLVVIDYLQLMNPEGRSESRVQEVSTLSRNLKLLARELNCPVLVLSQLSRETEKRTEHKPMLSDLRESGSIEQDADVVIFLYRDEIYNPDTAIPGECDVILAKQRSGPIGNVKVAWLSKITKFVDSAGSVAPPVF